MPERSDPDLAILPSFLAHLEPRDPRAADLARQLLDAGWQVQTLSGPVQMDVWQLTLRRDCVAVRFGIERGKSDSVLIGAYDGTSAELHPMAYAVLGWARASGVEFPLSDPDDFLPDHAAYGARAAEWLAAGNTEVYARIIAAQKEYQRRRHSMDQRLGDTWLAETRAWGVRLLEAAASPDRRITPADRTP